MQGQFWSDMLTQLSLPREAAANSHSTAAGQFPGADVGLLLAPQLTRQRQQAPPELHAFFNETFEHALHSQNCSSRVVQRL